MDTAWETAVAALPLDYTLEVRVHHGRGYVRYEPPARPGNRGPRQPRWTSGFGWNDGPATAEEALVDLVRQVRDATVKARVRAAAGM